MDLPDVFGMDAEKITEKKLAVLSYFIEHTSSVQIGIPPLSKGVVYPDKTTNNPRFFSYPERIERDFKNSHTKISNTWARRICEDLETLGILGHEMKRAARQRQPTEHFFLEYGFEPFRKVMKIIYENRQDLFCAYGFWQEYIQSHINENLVMDVLAEKNVEMSRYLNIVDWDPAESAKVYSLYYSRKNKTTSEWEKTRPDSYAESYDAYLHLVIKSQNTMKSPVVSGSPPRIMFRLPVFKSSVSEEERFKSIVTLNQGIFEYYPGLEKFQSVIHGHYFRTQENAWVLPILALIRASPAALEIFLFGDWKPYHTSPSCMDYPLFMFLFAAINEISVSRSVPSEKIIPHVRFRPDFGRDPDLPALRQALFEISMENGITVCYDASFDTEHYFFGTANGDVWENDREVNFRVLTWIDTRLSGAAISLDEIPDFDAFFRAFQDRKSKVSTYIVSKLPNHIRHFILYNASPIEEGSVIPTRLMEELNRVLMRPGFYNNRIFSDLALTDEGTKLIERTGLNRSGFDDSLYYYSLQKLNRQLIEESYPGLIMRARGIGEGTERFVMERESRVAPASH